MTVSPGSSPTPNPKPTGGQPSNTEPPDGEPERGDGAAHRAKHKADQAKYRATEAVQTAKTKAAEARGATKTEQDGNDSAPGAPSMTKGATLAKTPEPAQSTKPAPAPAYVQPPEPAQPTHPAQPAKAGEPDQASLGQLVTDATTAMSTLVHSEIELAKQELRSTVKIAGTSVGLFLAAAVVLVFSLTFGFIALAEGINALGLSRWLSFLIVFGFLLVLVGLSVLIGIRLIKRVKGPEQTIKTTKETVDYLKSTRA